MRVSRPPLAIPLTSLRVNSCQWYYPSVKRRQEEITGWAPPIQQEMPETQVDRDPFSVFAQFLRQNPLRILVTSAVLLIPIYWHRRIEAGDLASHVYNAWLVHLIRRGQAPGLWIARQWNNILFDVILSRFGELFGLRIAERMAVSFAVMTFFWSAFALIAAASRRAPWFLTPAIAIFTYGWTFEMGLMNFYISLGLSFFALAAFWHSAGRRRLIPLVLVPFIWMAHPLGIIWLLGSAAYLFLAEITRPRHRWYLLMAAGVFLIAVRVFLTSNYQVGWPNKPFYLYNGADQLVLFGNRYYVPAGLFIALALVALAIDVRSNERASNFWSAYRLPLELYGVAGMASVLLPSSVELAHYNAPIGLLTQRLSSLLGILACCILGIMRPRKWHLVGYTLIAVIFFSYLYQDTGIVNQMEEQVERSVATLPPGRQVLSAIRPPAGSRIVIQHIVDRACIGHCFSFENFEPDTGQFRVRATPGNTIAVVTTPISPTEQSDKNAVQSIVPPAFEVYPCGAGMSTVCVREFFSSWPSL